MIYLNSAMEKLLLNENDKKETLKTRTIIREVVNKTKIIKVSAK